MPKLSIGPEQTFMASKSMDRVSPVEEENYILKGMVKYNIYLKSCYSNLEILNPTNRRLDGSELFKTDCGKLRER